MLDAFLQQQIVPYRFTGTERPPRVPRRGFVLLLWRYALEAVDGLVHFLVFLVIAFPVLYATTRGRGAHIITVPGFLTNDWVLWPLRVLLNACGFRARGWGLGTNRGNVEQMTADFLNVVQGEYARNGGKPLHLVGWSLGGVVAREVARARPDLVASISTLASPIVGGPSFTVAAHNMSQARCAEIAAAAAAADRDRPLTVPVQTVFSKRDVIVDWPACLDKHSKDVVHYELLSRHLGIVFDPVAVWLVCRWVERHASKTKA